jgi:hypothetical protein
VQRSARGELRFGFRELASARQLRDLMAYRRRWWPTSPR